MTKWENKFESKNKEHKATMVFNENIRKLKEEISFNKIAIIDFESVSKLIIDNHSVDNKLINEWHKIDKLLSSKNKKRIGLITSNKPSTHLSGIPISVSLILNNNKKSDLFHFSILSEVSFKKGINFYKNRLVLMLKDIIKKIPDDYKVIVWGDKLEKGVFNFIEKEISVPSKKVDQLQNFFDLQKIFHNSTDKDDMYYVEFYANFRNAKNNKNCNNTKKLTLQSSLDFIKVIVDMMDKNESELNIEDFIHDRSLFEKINEEFSNEEKNVKFLEDLKKYNNGDVEGILLIFLWLNKKVNELI